MTGFAQGACITGVGKVHWEIRTLNSRYLELQLKLPEVLRVYEGQIREILTTRLQRGKVDVQVSLEPGSASTAAVELNAPLVQQLLGLEQSLTTLAARPMQWDMATLLQWPGVLQGVGGTLDPSVFFSALEESVTQLLVQRAQEGQRLQQVMLKMLTGLERCVQGIIQQVPLWNAGLKQRVQERWDKWQLSGEPADAVWTTLLLKSDIQEECDRLLGHIVAARSQLSKGGMVGKLLDFLSQEMLREANTLGVKVAALEGVEASVQLKVGIDQIREQAQNLV